MTLAEITVYTKVKVYLLRADELPCVPHGIRHLLSHGHPFGPRLQNHQVR
jgi:hypothetical protein